jgi:predicted ABC-type ATPase
VSRPRGTAGEISVLAGTNGAGKSSVAGRSIRARGGEYYNPDEATRLLLDANPGIGLDEANAQGWLQGKRLLENAIAKHLTFAFETTLGGNTIPALLEKAHHSGLAVRVWFVGLNSPELHIDRVKARVAKGGHDIPAAKIRERYDLSRKNLVRLMPSLTELWVFDNSADATFRGGDAPSPLLILHALDGVIQEACDVTVVPTWAKPIFIEALRVYST